MPQFTGIYEFIFIVTLFAVGAVISYVGRLLTNAAVFLLKRLWQLFIRLVVRSKRRFVIFNHQRHHRLPTTGHSDPLFVCLTNPCDTLYVNTQALGLPEEELEPPTAGLAADK